MGPQQFTQWCAALDVELLSVEQCATLVGQLAKVGKACDAARARLAARAAAGAAHRRRGYVDAADWLADATSTSSHHAKRTIETASQLGDCPATDQAWRSGEISQDQAAEIAKTEQKRPGSEAELLDTARRCARGALKERAQQLRNAGIDADELRRRQQAARQACTWVDDELGMTRLAAALVPEVGAAVRSRLEAETETLRRQARRDGTEQAWEAHAADALANLILGQPASPARPTKTDVVLVCDINAYRRGATQHGEVSHVVNGGPVPVWVVHDALDDDAFLKVAFHNGVEIHKIKHFGRHLNAELRTALDLGPPPHFPGERCSCGCGKRHKLQRDHIQPHAQGGPTQWANLQSLTPKEHAAKPAATETATHRDRRPSPRLRSSTMRDD